MQRLSRNAIIRSATRNLDSIWPDHLPSLMRSREAAAHNALAIGMIAGGFMAIGMLAIARLAIGRMSVGKLHLRELEIDDLTVHRVHNASRPAEVPYVHQPEGDESEGLAVSPEEAFTKEGLASDGQSGKRGKGKENGSEGETEGGKPH